MRKITSEGQGWEIEEDKSGLILLRLKSPYGIVELLAKDIALLFMMERIIEEYDKLKESSEDII